MPAAHLLIRAELPAPADGRTVSALADQEPGAQAPIRRAVEPGHDNAAEQVVVDVAVLGARGWVWDTT
jgi:hypothetical protein